LQHSINENKLLQGLKKANKLAKRMRQTILAANAVLLDFSL